MLLCQQNTVFISEADEVPAYGLWNGVTPKSSITNALGVFSNSGSTMAMGRHLGQFTFWCDNMAVVHAVNTLTPRFQRVMRLMRAFTLCCFSYNIVFQAHHVPGVNNELAVALSLQQIDRFRALAPGAQAQPEILPQEVWNIGGVKFSNRLQHQEQLCSCF